MQHLTDDFDVDHIKVMKNPLHMTAEDAFPNMERTIEESSAPDSAEMHTNAAANSWGLSFQATV